MVPYWLKKFGRIPEDWKFPREKNQVLKFTGQSVRSPLKPGKNPTFVMVRHSLPGPDFEAENDKKGIFNN
jgi:ATP sulfurylase